MKGPTLVKESFTLHWKVSLWSCGTTEVSHRYEKKFLCIYAWESPLSFEIPKHIQSLIAEQRRENW